MSVRRRRTAEESRSLILEVAARRLREHGLEGLNITGVAEEAGISHATLIHHFGSSGGMRDALVDKMTLDLMEDLVSELGKNVPPKELIGNVFEALAVGGHAKLIAWRAVDGEAHPGKTNMETFRELFARLIDSSAEVLNRQTQDDLRQLVYLVAIAAIGHGLAGDTLAHTLGMSSDEVEAFPAWLNDQLS